MPDLFNTFDGDRASATHGATNIADRDGNPKRGPDASPRAKGRRAKVDPRYGGALTAALATALADTSGKQTKDQRAASVIPDIVAAMEAFPGVKPSKLWPLLQKLDPENDGAHFRRAVIRMLREEAVRTPVVALSLPNRTSPVTDASAEGAQAGKPAAAPVDDIASRPAPRPANSDGPSSLEAELRGLRAPGF